MPIFTNPYIRDDVVVDHELEELINGYAGSGPLVLLGRTVRLVEDVRIARHALVIVADLFDGGGFLLDASGAPSSAAGAPGADGVPLPMSQMYSLDGRPLAGGSPGASGGVGGAGAPGNTVTVYARHTRGARISVAGGSGAPGGWGGNGTAGANGAVLPDRTEQRDLTPHDPWDFEFEDVFIPGETIDGTPGGSGGWGGAGGNGGNGGTVAVTSIADDTPPELVVSGGAGAWGGGGGAAGPDGQLSAVTAVAGEPGPAGAWGAEGSATHANVSEADFAAGLRPLLDATGGWADLWAPFRVATGDYRYHRHNAGDPGTADDLRLAAIEFERALELQPGNGSALRLQAQLIGEPQVLAESGERIWAGGGTNALGYPPDLDILPSFDAYISAFQGFAGLSADFLFAGVDDILDSGTAEGLARLAGLQKRSADAAKNAFDDDVEIATTEKKIATDDVALVQKQLDQAAADLETEMATLEETPFSFGDLIGTVASVATAVVGVIAAIPTGGASLVALVPAMVSLADTVLDEAEPIAQALFAGTKADTEKVEEAYKKVDKEIGKVVAAGKSIVNFVAVIDRLSASAKADNSTEVALVRRGAELAHQLLMARDRVTLAQQRIDAAHARGARAAELAAEAEALQHQLTADAASVRRVGLLAITIAQSSAQALTSLAFRAARSVEIYTLQPQTQNLALDAGILSPDVWRDYQEERMTDGELAAALTASWGAMLSPLAIQRDYLAYFERAHDQDVLSLHFAPGDREFDRMLATGGFDFRVEADDIPAGRADAKIRSIRLALVGASHPTGALSCEITHGGVYEQRRADGTITVQRLQPRTSTRRAVVQPLNPEEGALVDQPLTAPLSLAFWGRGVGGDWSVAVARASENNGIDLTGMTQIQVEIRYQFLR